MEHLQKIYYGAPGTGKSHAIFKLLEEVDEEQIVRVTIHPEYTYSDFVGQLLPEKIGTNIEFNFKEGPFTQALKKAFENFDKSVYLVIEELSRGNVSAIFGDIFQLLDRDEHFESKFKIYNKDVADRIPALVSNNIYLPPNFNILCTVNLNDQNVMPMDTAFKRRFDWEYISTKPQQDNGEFLNNQIIKLNNGVENKNISWIDLYMALNKFISSSEYLGLGEDKQIGQFFIIFDDEKYKEKIQNKLLHYLWFDIQGSTYKNDLKLFDDKVTCFSDLYEMYENDEKIFSDEFFKCMNL